MLFWMTSFMTLFYIRLVFFSQLRCGLEETELQLDSQISASDFNNHGFIIEQLFLEYAFQRFSCMAKNLWQINFLESFYIGMLLESNMQNKSVTPIVMAHCRLDM